MPKPCRSIRSKKPQSHCGKDMRNATSSDGLKNNTATKPEGSELVDYSTGSPSKRKRLQAFTARTEEKAKELFNLQAPPERDGFSQPESDDADDLFSDPAFHPSEVTDHSSETGQDTDSGVGQTIKLAGHAFLHPREALRKKTTKKAAGKVSSASTSFLTSNQDRDFLDAHDGLAKATSRASSAHLCDSSEDNDVENARRKVEKLEDHRASLRTAWALDRHVDRVRVVRTHMTPSQASDYYDHVSEDEQQFDWARWLARLAVYHTYGFTCQYIDDMEEPPFDMQDLTRTLERFAMVSAPWQSFFIQIRKVYIWEDPKRTSKWMLLFWTLFYTEHLVSFVYGYIIYMIVRNRYYPTSADSIKETMKRGTDREARAQAWGELIQRHGRNDWIEPLLDEIGPMIQLQLGDLTDFLEVLTNFYRWERPNKTAQSVFFLAVCLLTTVLANTRFCVKIVWFLVGSGFFFLYPVATRYPKYRKVVGGWRWMFWNIPSHAELGIIHLQEKALSLDTKAVNQSNSNSSTNSSTSEYETADEFTLHEPLSKAQYTFRAYRGKTSGRLYITRTSLRYRFNSDDINIPFVHLREIRKEDLASKSDKLLRPNTEGLLFIYTEVDMCRSLQLNVKTAQRQEIFSLVLAWSGLRWQVVPMERHRTRGGEKGVFDKSLKRLLGQR